MICVIFKEFNPLTTIAISKLLKLIGRSAYFPRVLDRDRFPFGHKPDLRLGCSSEYVRKSMHACRSVSAACRPAEQSRRCGKIGSVQRSILVGRKRPIDVLGLYSLNVSVWLTQRRSHPKAMTLKVKDKDKKICLLCQGLASKATSLIIEKLLKF